MKKKTIIKLLSFSILFLVISFGQGSYIEAAGTASPVSAGVIDYENLTMQVYANNNSVVFYSTDKATWTVLDAPYNTNDGSYQMDISWVSEAKAAVLYLKGDVVKTVVSLELPVQDKDFKVVYDKAEGEFTFDNTRDYNYFEWRKASDYNWMTVSLNETSASFQNFLAIMETFKTKGASILCRLPQRTGSGINNPGERPSKAVSVKIIARSNAPAIKVNASKLTLNTSSSMEYYNKTLATWIECNSSMSLEDIAPSVLYRNGAGTVTLMIRRAATNSLPYSKTAYLTISGQAAAPVIGDSNCDVTYYYLNSKLVMQFNKASATNRYEYAIVKKGTDFNAASARWRLVSTSKLMTLTKSTAPDGCTIYVRKKGTDANTSKSIELILASDTNSFKVGY